MTRTCIKASGLGTRDGEFMPVALRLRCGSKSDRLPKRSRAWLMEKIVLAAHNGTFFEFQLHGSVSANVERRSPVPVLCLRQSPFHHEPETIAQALQREFQPTPV